MNENGQFPLERASLSAASSRFSGLMFTFLALSIGIQRTQGMTMYSYDLDSLVYMSTQIVEGTLGGAHRTNNFDVWQVTISKVHMGKFTNGEVIEVTALDFFTISTNGDIPEPRQPLKAGDHLFLFLARAQPRFLYDVPTNAEIYWPAPSGIKIVVGSKAIDFHQFENPGPYVAVVRSAETNVAIPTVEDLRQQIRLSQERVEKWRPLLARTATLKDVPALLDVLRVERSNRYSFGPNSIAVITCQHLADLRDVSAVTNGMNIAPAFSRTLAPGLDSAAGRAFLWSRFTDEKRPLDERLKWVSFLPVAGEGSREEHHMKRLAELATNSPTDSQFQTALLDSLQGVENWRRFTQADRAPDENTRAGLDEAAVILKSYSDKTDSQMVKNRIEKVLSQFNGGPR